MQGINSIVHQFHYVEWGVLFSKSFVSLPARQLRHWQTRAFQFQQRGSDSLRQRVQTRWCWNDACSCRTSCPTFQKLGSRNVCHQWHLKTKHFSFTYSSIKNCSKDESISNTIRNVTKNTVIVFSSWIIIKSVIIVSMCLSYLTDRNFNCKSYWKLPKANGYCHLSKNSWEHCSHSSLDWGSLMHSSLSSCQSCSQTSGMMRLRVFFGIRKMSSSSPKDAPLLKYLNVTWSLSLAEIGSRMFVTCFVIFGSILKP